MALTEVSPGSGDPFIDSVINNGRHYVNSEGEDGPFNINYYFDDRLGYTWRPFEKAAWSDAVTNWEHVANVTFTEVDTPEAALFRESLEDQAQSVSGGSTTVSASHSLPSANVNAQSIGTYNFEAVNIRQWTPDQLEPGGNFYRTFMHETGHGLGLKHTFDNGSNGHTYFPGVEADQSSAERQRDLGFNDANHMFGSIMAYVHGYTFDEEGHIDVLPTRQRPVADDFFLDHGFAATPMAYDIAAVQYLYGANMSYRTGNDVYYLPDSNDPHPFIRSTEENEAGVSEKIEYLADTAFWASIWDAGGTDEMRYDGNRDAILDLTAATLDFSATSYGVLSYAAFIGGGYTIANGVVIENATGGENDDVITGNQVANLLLGRGGDDVLTGGGGDDTLDGGDGIDSAVMASASTQVEILHQSDGSVLLVDGSAASLGTDTLRAIERVVFTDRTIDLVPIDPLAPFTRPDGSIDWDAAAAQVNANLAETGGWYL